MPEPIKPQANPIEPVGEPVWAPSAEDDDNAAVPPRRQDIRAIFIGDDGLRAGWSALLFLVFFSGILAAIRFAWRAAEHGTHTQPTVHALRPGLVYASDLGGFVVALIAALLLSRIEHRRLGRYGIGKLSARRTMQFGAGAALGLGMLALLVGTLWMSHAIAVQGVLLHGTEALRWGLVWAGAFLSVGLFEEYLTRGVLQFTLTRGLAGLARAAGMQYRASVVLGFWVAAALFSLLFGLGHTSNPGESPIGIVSAIVIALLFAFSLWRTGSLWWAIGFHAAWDWAQSFLFGTADSGLAAQHHLIATAPVGSVLRSGGLTGPEGSAYILLEMLITFAVIALFLKPEPGSYADPSWTPNDAKPLR